LSNALLKPELVSIYNKKMNDSNLQENEEELKTFQKDGIK
jgi:hypothetical protein